MCPELFLFLIETLNIIIVDQMSAFDKLINGLSATELAIFVRHRYHGFF
jgi:hypothetical protein